MSLEFLLLLSACVRLNGLKRCTAGTAHTYTPLHKGTSRWLYTIVMSNSPMTQLYFSGLEYACRLRIMCMSQTRTCLLGHIVVFQFVAAQRGTAWMETWFFQTAHNPILYLCTEMTTDCSLSLCLILSHYFSLFLHYQCTRECHVSVWRRNKFLLPKLPVAVIKIVPTFLFIHNSHKQQRMLVLSSIREAWLL